MTSINKFTKANGLICKLETLLMGYTKTQLLDTAASLNSTFPKSWNKNKLATELSDKIDEQARTIYQEMLTDIIKRLPNQEQSVYAVESLEGIESLKPLIDKGFIYVHPVNDSFMLIIPEEILDAAAEKNDRQWSNHQHETSHSQTIDTLMKWKENAIKIYGNFSPSHFQSIWNRYYTEKLSVEEIEDILSN